MQFRYARNWVAPSIVDRIPRERLADRPVLVCFLAGNGSAAQPYQIVPIRYARLIRAELVGTSCLFIFEAGDFANDLNDADVRAAVDSSTVSRLPGVTGANQAFFVFRCTLPCPMPWRGMNLGAFESTVSRVAAFPPFTGPDTVFFTLFRLSRLRKFSWFGTWPHPRWPSRLNMGSYVLPSGKRYECEVYCLKPNDPPAGVQPGRLKLSVEADDDQLKFVSATHGDIDSKYDVKRFLCQSDVGILDRLTGFRLFITDQTNNTTYRDLSLPVVLRRSFILGPVKGLLITAAVAGTAMLAANAAGKLDLKTAALLFVLGVFAGITSVFPSVKKP